MHINIKRFFGLVALLVAAGCGMPQDDWYGEYRLLETGAPDQMQYGEFSIDPALPDNINAADTRRMAVLLPMSGASAQTGRAIRASIETAILQRGPQNLAVAFYDTGTNPTDAINKALAGNPEIIVGPLFARNARAVRDVKPANLPVLSFTSDATAVGNGVMTMALMPTNSVEAIVKEMAADGTRNFVILAPDTESGRLMAGTAKSAAGIYNIGLSGIFYYKEKDSDSIKNATHAASMNAARTAANTRAREILSDILTKETLTTLEKSSLNRQLEKISKSDTLGNVPYDAVLFLGTAADAKSLASFMRYYGVGARDVRYYGTAVWDGTDVASDLTMSGAKFATLPEMSENFANVYEQVAGAQPTRLSTFGYDAANMAMGMIYSTKSDAAYLLDPSGYVGMDGLFRLKPTGENERALRIVETDGNGGLRTVKPAATTFMTPIYNIEQRYISPARAMNLETNGVNPMDYISVPQRFQSKYRGKTYGANIAPAASAPVAEVVTILPEDDSDVIVSPDFQPVELESVNRTYIDSVEIEE